MAQALTTSLAILLFAVTGLAQGANLTADLSRYRPECGVSVHERDGLLDIAWPIDSGEFGRVQLTLSDGPLVNPHCRLIQIQPIVSTSEDRRAIVYDTGILGEQAGWQRYAWMNTEGQLHRAPIVESTADRPIANSH